ncbi:MAG: hypothetical protein GY787_30275 [Alteromonadales bacterium]|nr:hypothetical protein [Alteromonadales bacterium]
MKFSIIVFSITIALTGCVNIKAPDNLVSDTVSVSKDIYHSIKDNISEEDTSENVFSASHILLEDESFSVANEKCIDAAIEKAKQSLNKYSLEIKNTFSNVENIDGEYILKCSVSV